jgi:STAS-like domain of unknown function (DUF4325)
MKYNILSITGAYCTTPEAGQKVYDLIHPILLSGEQVELDFLGVKAYASPFFNYAIGQLLKDISAESLGNLIRFINISSVGESVLRLVIDNAKQYYADETFRKAVDEAVEEELAAC